MSRFCKTVIFSILFLVGSAVQAQSENGTKGFVVKSYCEYSTGGAWIPGPELPGYMPYIPELKRFTINRPSSVPLSSTLRIHLTVSAGGVIMRYNSSLKRYIRTNIVEIAPNNTAGWFYLFSESELQAGAGLAGKAPVMRPGSKSISINLGYTPNGKSLGNVGLVTPPSYDTPAHVAYNLYNVHVENRFVQPWVRGVDSSLLEYFIEETGIRDWPGNPGYKQRQFKSPQVLVDVVAYHGWGQPSGDRMVFTVYAAEDAGAPVNNYYHPNQSNALVRYSLGSDLSNGPEWTRTEGTQTMKLLEDIGYNYINDEEDAEFFTRITDWHDPSMSGFRRMLQSTNTFRYSNDSQDIWVYSNEAGGGSGHTTEYDLDDSYILSESNGYVTSYPTVWSAYSGGSNVWNDGFIKSKTDTTGAWSYYDYHTDPKKRGMVYRLYEPGPFADAPAAPTATYARTRVTEYDYAADWDGALRLPSTIKTFLDGSTKQVGRTDFFYDHALVAGGEKLTKTTSRSYSTASSYIEAVSISYRTDTPSLLLADMPYALVSPQGTSISYAYEKGSWNATTGVFTPSPTGAAFRVLKLQGTKDSAAGSLVANWRQSSAFAAFDVNDLRLVPYVSTMEATIKDARGFTVKTEEYVFAGGLSGTTVELAHFVLADCSTMTYDKAGNLIKRVKLNGATYEAEYTNVNGSSETASSIVFSNTGARTGRKQYEKLEDGTVKRFLYDNLGRVRVEKTLARGTVPQTSKLFEYDPEHRVTKIQSAVTNASGVASGEVVTLQARTYDTTGRVTAETDERGYVTTYVYDDANRKTTVTGPDGTATVTELYRDGSTRSVTGTGAVAQY